MSTKTMDELRTEHGIERYVTAFSIFMKWYFPLQHPISIEQMQMLKDQDELAFEIFQAHMSDIANDIIKRSEAS